MLLGGLYMSHHNYNIHVTRYRLGMHIRINEYYTGSKSKVAMFGYRIWTVYHIIIRTYASIIRRAVQYTVRYTRELLPSDVTNHGAL